MIPDQKNIPDDIVLKLDKCSDILTMFIFPYEKVENYNEHMIQTKIAFKKVFSYMIKFKEVLYKYIDTKNEKPTPLPPYQECYIPSNLKSLFYDNIWSYVPQVFEILEYIGGLYNMHTELYKIPYDEIEKGMKKGLYKDYLGYFPEKIFNDSPNDYPNGHTNNHTNNHTNDYDKHSKNTSNTSNTSTTSNTSNTSNTSYFSYIKEKVQQFIPMVKPIMKTVVSIINLFL